jgi:protein-L-isoaspartate(D-aspartate) O-methyltransferase
LLDHLADDGIMLLPLGPQGGAQRIVRLTKGGGGIVNREDLIAVRFVPLLPGKAREL